MSNASNLAEERRKHLQDFMAETGLEGAEWCRNAGISSSTLYNFFNRRSQSLSIGTLQKLAAAAKVPLWRLTGDVPPQVTVRTPQITIRGQVEAGNWSSRGTEWPQVDLEELAVPVPKQYEDSAFGLMVHGPSMDKVYPEGTIIVCVPFGEYGRDLRPGVRVVVHRHAEDGMAVEATVKELAADNEGRIWLWPRSSHPAHQAPIELPRPSPEDYDLHHAGSQPIEIVAVVIGSYRPEDTTPITRIAI